MTANPRLPFPQVGDRVELVAKHPFAGEAGVVTAIEHIEILKLDRPRVHLDNGTDCFIVDSDHWRPAQ